jgi:hypothetical protein
MENFLPRDMIQEILGRLHDKEIFMYGMTSKKCLESAEWIWKKKYERLTKKQNGDLIVLFTGTSWFSLYVKEIKSNYSEKITNFLILFRILETQVEKKDLLEEMYNFILEHLSFLSMKRFKSLRDVFQSKLKEFIKSDSLYEHHLGLKYYPLLFPEDYHEYLAMKYLEDPEDSQEDPDYV